MLYGIDNVVNTELRFFSKTRERIDTCMNYTRPPLAIEIDTIRKAFLEAKRRNVRLSYSEVISAFFNSK